MFGTNYIEKEIQKGKKFLEFVASHGVVEAQQTLNLVLGNSGKS